VTIGDLNKASEADFIALLGAIYEHSPWIAARAAAARPFANVSSLHAAMAGVVQNATANEQLGLVAAHPDLGGRLARAGTLAPSSADEQANLGLDRLSDEEFAAFEALNTAYRDRFGFPFVIAVKRHTRKSVLSEFQSRLTNDPGEERQTALREIDMIARFRLDALLAE
jgi:2-oxo-4-hydroxy-4-carboxy-5-ureidoimidazoline decarboxylase